MATNRGLWKVGGSDVIAAYMGNTQVYPPFNEATGGTVTEVDNYNGTGQKWRIHEFTSNGSLNITKDKQPFRVLVVGGGANGERSYQNLRGGSGGNGGKVLETTTALTVGATTVTVGGTNADSTVGALSSASGVAGGVGGSGVNGQGPPGGDGPSSDITGTLLHYAGGGGGGSCARNDGPFYGWSDGGNRGGGRGGAARNSYPAVVGTGEPGVANTGGGGGGSASVAGEERTNGGPGASGIVIVAYRIG